MATEGDEAGTSGYRAAFERSPEATLLHDDSGAIRDANEAAAALLDQSADRLQGQTLSDLHPGADTASLRQEAGETGTACAEWEIEAAGKSRRVDARLEAVDGTHRVTYLQDVASEYGTQAQIREQRDHLEAVVSELPVVLFALDPEGTFTMSRGRALDRLGLEPGELDGASVFDVYADYPDIVDAAERALDGESVRVEQTVDGLVFETQYTPVTDEDGEVAQVIGVSMDVTERKAREQQFQTLLEAVPAGVFMAGTDGTVEFVNDEWVDVVDPATSDPEGRQMSEILSPEQIERFRDHHEAAVEQREPVEREHTFKTGAGEAVVRAVVAPLTTGGGTSNGVVGVAQDVTERTERKRKLEQRSRAMESAIDGMAIVDGDGQYVYVNDAHADVYGFEDTDAFLGETWRMCYGDEEQRRLEEEVMPRVRETGEWRGEAVGRRVDGSAFPQEMSLSALDDGGLVCVVRDVSERKARERRLERNEVVLDQLTDTSEIVFWLFDGLFEEVEFINDAYEEVWGRSVERLREDPTDFMAGVHPDDREGVRERIERLANGESIEHEYRVNPEEDFQRWVLVQGNPVFDEDGNVDRVAGIVRDITERKERERALERSERQFEAVFNDPHLLAGVLDTDGTVERINATALTIAGVDAATIEGTPFPETRWWNHDEELQADLREWIARAADGEYVEFEATHPHPDGGEMDVEGTIRPVTDEDGEVVSLVVSSQDITARKERKRELEKSNERLEQFAYVASHDLQEPLRTISNYTEMLAADYGDRLDGDAQRFMDVIVTGSERMQSMINGLLDYSRVTTRGSEFEPVDVEAVVEDVADDLEVMLEEEGGDLHWGSLPTVDADGDQLRQVVQNLVKNALEHGGETVDVELRGSDEGDHYRFEVEDDGPGIEPSRQEKIFRIFKSSEQYQTESQAKGIGLAICEQIVDRHGGDIWVESEPGSGATFVFTIAKEKDGDQTDTRDDHHDQ